MVNRCYAMLTLSPNVFDVMFFASFANRMTLKYDGK